MRYMDGVGAKALKALCCTISPREAHTVLDTDGEQTALSCFLAANTLVFPNNSTIAAWNGVSVVGRWKRVHMTLLKYLLCASGLEACVAVLTVEPLPYATEANATEAR